MARAKAARASGFGSEVRPVAGRHVAHPLGARNPDAMEEGDEWNVEVVSQAVDITGEPLPRHRPKGTR